MSKERFSKIKKLAQTSSTQPLYELSDGTEVTAADIVTGKVKPPDIWPANSYKPKSIYKSKRRGGKKKSSGNESSMVKQSYRSSIDADIKPIRNMPVINLSDNSGNVMFGYIPTTGGEQHGVAESEFEDHFWNENDDNFTEGHGGEPNEFDIIEYLVSLSDSLDKSGQHFFSNFTDYIIKRASEAEPEDHSQLLSDLILKINSSDLSMKVEKIKGLVARFTESVNKNIKSGDDIGLAKRKAYADSVSVFNKIMRSSGG
jgi:hypothetical protein